MAEISLARLQFDAALRIYDERRHHLHATRYGLDPAILCLVHLIWTRWLDGETEAAVETELETLALASRLGHPLSLAHALNFSAVHRQFRAEAAETQRFVVQEIALSQEHHLPHYAAYATILSGWVCAARGDPSRGVRLIMQGLDARRETGAELAKPFFLTLLAQAQHADGNVKAALDALAEAEEVMGRTAERWRFKCEGAIDARRRALAAQEDFIIGDEGLPNVDPERFPLFERAHKSRIEFILEPGDMLFIPGLYYLLSIS